MSIAPEKRCGLTFVEKSTVLYLGQSGAVTEMIARRCRGTPETAMKSERTKDQGKTRQRRNFCFFSTARQLQPAREWPSTAFVWSACVASAGHRTLQKTLPCFHRGLLRAWFSFCECPPSTRICPRSLIHCMTSTSKTHCQRTNQSYKR